MKMSKRSSQLAIVFYCSAIILLSILKINGSGSLSKSKIAGFRSDYLLHILMFVPFMTLAQWGWGYSDRGKPWFWPAFAAGLLLAAVSECLQWFMPYRTFNTWDLGANCLGIVLGALIAGWRKKVVSR